MLCQEKVSALYNPVHIKITENMKLICMLGAQEHIRQSEIPTSTLNLILFMRLYKSIWDWEITANF